MWLTVQLAFALLAAQPTPDAYVHVGCPFLPVNFENGSREMGPAGRDILMQMAHVFTRPGEPVPRVVLHTYSNEPASSQREALLEARADAVRRVLIEGGFAPDNILITYEIGDSPWGFPDGWVGGQVTTEYFLPRGLPRPPGAPEPPIC